MTNDVHERVRLVIEADGTSERVSRYFAPPEPGVRGFAGRLFEQFGGGGDTPAVADGFTAEDLLAVEALSVSVPSDVAYELLYGPLHSELAAFLRDVPTDVDLGTPDAAEHLTAGAPAHTAWEILDRQPGIGWVTAGKLLARKRPRLLPVYDDVVRCVLGRPRGVWLELHETVSDPEIRNAIESLRPSSAEHVSTLRLLDVAIWMSHRTKHREGTC